MKWDIGLSVALHLAVVTAMLVASPFEIKKRDFGEVIRVSLTALPPMMSRPPETVGVGADGDTA
jgi:hypothetical protein